MHETHRRPRRWGRLAGLAAALVRLVRPGRGLHNAPRKGDPFPTGPMERYEPDPYAGMALKSLPLPPRARYHPYAMNAETMVDMPVISPRPYLNPVLTGGER